MPRAADQFSVHRNPGRNRRAIPYVVVVQSNRSRSSSRQVVVPLASAEEFGSTNSDLGPGFSIEGQAVVMDPLQITNVPRDVLGPAVASLAEEDGRIVNALDALLSRAWR